MEEKMDVNTKVARNVEQATEIFEEYADTIRAAIRFHSNDKSNIDDIFQDFFLSLVQKPIQRRDQGFKAFINKAIRNDVLDVASQNRSYHQRNYKYAQMHKDRFKPETPDDITSHAEEIERLFDIVENQLLQYETEAIIHKYRYGKDASETAEAMGINRRSVSCYLCTGLKKLRKLVQGSLQDDCFVETDTME
jgi:RNA polymerase sigma factor (sigma-70 family)